MPRYELSEGTSNKFWEIVLSGVSFTTSWGRIGTQGQQATKTFDTAAKAEAEHDKLVAEKVKKGYALVGPSASPPAPAPTPTPTPAATATPTATPTPAPTATPTPAPTPPHPPKPAPPHTPTPSPPTAASTQAPAPSFELSRELRNQALRQAAALKVPTPAELPSGWFGDIVEGLRTRGLRTMLKHGLQRRGVLAPPVERLLTRAMDGFTVFEAEVEGDLLRLIPVAEQGRLSNLGRHEQRTAVAARLVASLCERWGLVRAVEAFEALVRQPGTAESVRESSGTQVYLRPQQDHGAAIRDRVDQALRAHLLAASPNEFAAAKARAGELRAQAPLGVASALNTLFADPEWTRTDLLARVLSGKPWVFSEEVLLSAQSGALAGWLEGIHKSELDLFFSLPYELRATLSPMLAALAARLDQEAPEVFAAWVRGVLKLQQTHVPTGYADTLVWLPSIHELIEVLAGATDHVPTLEAAIAVIDLASPLKLGKKDDPTPRTLELLLKSPHTALPLVRQATHGKASGWARDLVGRLTRASTPITYETADPDEVPQGLLGKKPFKAPGFWVPASLTPPRLHNGKALPLAALDGLALLLTHESPELAEVKEACTPQSLSAFAWDLFQAWLTSGAPSKDKWAFLALGHLGNDDTARRLTPLIRAWPGESAHARAVLGLDVLSIIGTDVALMMLNGIAQKVKFKGLQERARQAMDEIAESRGLSSEELADRLVPDLDLDDDGSKVLDFGPRSFRVGFDETLSPFVMDATGSRLKDLPKPNSKDDPALSAEAVEVWKATKKDAKALAAIQLLRLELAMGNARRWRADIFEALLVHHPLLVHVVRRLVWGVYEGRKLIATFRVAEDRTFASHEDDTFTLDPSSVVGLVHRLELDDTLASRWIEVFTDYELAQPFVQLTREAHRLHPAEEASSELTRFVGRVVETRRMLGLTSRGWRRGPAQDNGNVWWFTKEIGPDNLAVLRFEYGINVSSLEYSDPTQTLGIVDFGPGDPGWSQVRPLSLPLGSLDPIVVSEVIADLESLGQVVGI